MPNFYFFVDFKSAFEQLTLKEIFGVELGLVELPKKKKTQIFALHCEVALYERNGTISAKLHPFSSRRLKFFSLFSYLCQLVSDLKSEASSSKIVVAARLDCFKMRKKNSLLILVIFKNL